MTASPSIVRTVADLRAAVAAWRSAGLTTGLVPTMGALHEGHLTLVRAALAACDRAVVTIFVNPTQFGPNEDFARYPRDEAADAAKLAAAGAHLLFAPDVGAMYPEGFATSVRVAGPLTEGLCAPFRPGHFEGVATVVAKLLLQALPTRAYFGQKDYQQLQVIRRMARDLDIPVAIEGVPTVREADGLAMSSRNAYLDADQRALAGRLPRVLRDAAGEAVAGSPEAAAERARERLLAEGFDRVDYVEVRDAQTLQRVTGPAGDARVFAAAWIGRTRLIDNLAVEALA